MATCLLPRGRGHKWKLPTKNELRKLRLSVWKQPRLFRSLWNPPADHRVLAAAEAAAGSEWPVARRAFSIRRKPVRSLHKVSVVVPYIYATFGRDDGRFGAEVFG